MSNLRVAIMMGSDSDLPVMKEASEQLQSLGVTNEMRVLSAHRTPIETAEYVKGLEARGVKVIIAGAGGAAHLPGVVASLCVLPVIGVPINATPLQGVDALYAIVQMPKGIPVASVAIGGAANAGILAAEIIASGDSDEAHNTKKKLLEAREEMRKKVLGKRI